MPRGRKYHQFYISHFSRSAQICVYIICWIFYINMMMTDEIYLKLYMNITCFSEFLSGFLGRISMLFHLRKPHIYIINLWHHIYLRISPYTLYIRTSIKFVRHTHFFVSTIYTYIWKNIKIFTLHTRGEYTFHSHIKSSKVGFSYR